MKRILVKLKSWMPWWSALIIILLGLLFYPPRAVCDYVWGLGFGGLAVLYAWVIWLIRSTFK